MCHAGGIQPLSRTTFYFFIDTWAILFTNLLSLRLVGVRIWIILLLGAHSHSGRSVWFGLESRIISSWTKFASYWALSVSLWFAAQEKDSLGYSLTQTGHLSGGDNLHLEPQKGALQWRLTVLHRLLVHNDFDDITIKSVGTYICELHVPAVSSRLDSFTY